MGCFAALIGLCFPRVTLVLLWLFTTYVDHGPFKFWLWPLLGMIFMPFTTLALVWAFNTEFALLQMAAVVLGVVLDLSNNGHAEYRRRRRTDG